MKRITHISEAAPAVGPYSLVTVHGNFVETSGQVALTPEGHLVQGTVAEETDQIMSNLKAILGAAGCTFADVTSVVIYYTKDAPFSEINQAYAKYFAEGEYPARATVGVAFLPLPEARIEIAMRAVLSGTN